MSAHSETAFEEAIEHHLVTHAGYGRGHSADYDRARALLPDAAVAFVKATQPRKWAKWAGHFGADLPETFAAALAGALDKQGTLHVLRHGFDFYAKTVRMAYFAPTHGRNPAVQARYAANRLTVVRQLHFDPDSDRSVDLALFVNGVPVATAELKNALTGQTVAHAVKQYRGRDPHAPLFRWKARALVHFAVDTERVKMTTRLRGSKTVFLPFDRGHGHGAGNPPVEGKQRTAYLWEEVWPRASLLDLVRRFVHLERKVETDPDTGKVTTSERVIFPRYHQLDCVRRLVDAARADGAGHHYLVQHSAGSGKSNSIAWLAHRLSSLHGADDRKVFDSVIVLTDRRVLDKQLQDTIFQFDHEDGVVEKVDKHSKQLAAALAKGVPIIISTIHKFGYLHDKIAALPDRRYAVIVDEAHSSQTGDMALDVRALLADGAVDAQVEAEVAEAIDDGEVLTEPGQLALRVAILRRPLGNLSFFAFTATPKYKTLVIFGHTGDDGKPAPFHLYSMRQAIEEGFIVDVLKGYVTWQRFYKLQKALGSDPDVDKRKAAAALIRYVNLHPEHIRQKAAIIIEHFRAHVAHLLDGRAKAMVVTDSRLMAVRYRQAFDAYISERGYAIGCLAAFSGEVKDPDIPGEAYTEPGMNGGIPETALPERFASKAFRLLIVASKYQTGFDEPRLCAMYVDKRLNGIQAVQTLSRLNRRFPGKQTRVLDFVNRREDILKSFQAYYESTTIAEAVDPQRLYGLVHDLEQARVWTASEVQGFAAVFFALKPDADIADHGELNHWLDPAVDRFVALADAEGGEEAQGRFRGQLGAFVNLYGFMAQVVPFPDARLEQLYVFARMLARKLPRPPDSGPIDLGDGISLKSLKIKKMAQGDLLMAKGEPGELKGPTATGTGGGAAPMEKLSAIIEALNTRFATDFEAQDLVDEMAERLVGDGDLQQAARVNDKANFRHVFGPELDDVLIDSFDRVGRHSAFVTHIYDDAAFGQAFRELMLDLVYGRLRHAAGEPAGVP